MTGIEVREVDRTDEAQIRAFWELERDAVAERPYNDHLAWHAAKTYFPMDFPGPARWGAGCSAARSSRPWGRAARRWRSPSMWGPLPDELVGGFLAIQNMFISEAPSGDADVENEVWDEARLRGIETRAAAARRQDARTFAVTRDGEVVALTEAFVNETRPDRGLQSGTLVVGDHRGHRIGLAIKVANQQAMAERFPELEWLMTGNADVNVHMNAINDRLGYRVVGRCLEVEKTI